MHYKLIKDLVDLVAIYELESDHKKEDVHLFVQWISKRFNTSEYPLKPEPEWKGKSNGRSGESVINTSLVHLYRYAKILAKNAVADSTFSTPDDFIYLITLVAQGSMTKTALIKYNVHEKSSGIQIVNRLISNGYVEQITTEADKRSRMVHITEKGAEVLKAHMPKIKKASHQVTEPLSYDEKMDLISLLLKLENFHEARLS